MKFNKTRCFLLWVNLHEYIQKPNLTFWSTRICRNKLEWNTIDTMSLICWSWKPFTFKHMTKMSATSCTGDFNPHSIWIRLNSCKRICIRYNKIKSNETKIRMIEAHIAIYGPGKTFVECWPATTRVKFGCGSVKWSSTSCTTVNAFAKELVVFSRPWIPKEQGILIYLHILFTHTVCTSVVAKKFRWC